MNKAAITQTLHHLQITPDAIQDEQVAEAFRRVLQLVEALSEENTRLQKEIQKLRDEINLLKGEQAKPEIAASKKNQQEDSSSEKERKRPKPRSERKTKAKKAKIHIDRSEVCKVNREILPEDAEFKGYQEVIVQDILISTATVQYKKEVYYSPSRHKTYRGALPVGVEGEFGSGVKSLVYTLKHVANMSEPKIGEFFDNVGISISGATISRILTHNNTLFHQDKIEIVQAGLSSTVYQQIDDTGGSVNGENHYVHILCNPYYTAYFTLPHKNRVGVLDLLQGTIAGPSRHYYFTEEAFALLDTFRVSQKVIGQIRRETVCNPLLNDGQMQYLLGRVFPDPEQGKILRVRIMEAGAIAAYHHQTDYPVIPVRLSDDAPQFKHLTREHGLCWVHDGRHYKKLHPVVPYHQGHLEAFLEQYWEYYRELLPYRAHPTQEQAEFLSAEFDQVFSTQTGDASLDERIAKSKAKKSELLFVLKYPQLPLHNNAAELGARAQVRKRDVSLQTRTKEGTEAKDPFLTIVQTATKLRVRAYEYIHDRVNKTYSLPSLASLIRSKASLELGYHDSG